MITPAISVLSAVEGLRIVEPGLEALVIPITVVIILALFAAQRVGTARVGRLFGPVMTLWFLTIAAAGIGGIIAEPEILRALSPTYAIGFLVGRFEIAFFALAAVVLAITGAEALYADLGHFGRSAISRAWLVLVFPACTLSYFGQGALLLADPGPNGAVRAPFFLLVPSWGLIPLVVLATAATVIASQAVITGAFSVARQAVRLGYLPRLRIVHTSAQTIGQIYVPWVNWALMVMVIVLVLAFQSSAALAYAFGMAVTGTIIVTTLLLFYVARRQWGWPRWRRAGRRSGGSRHRGAVPRRQPHQAAPRGLAATRARRWTRSTACRGGGPCCSIATASLSADAARAFELPATARSWSAPDQRLSQDRTYAPLGSGEPAERVLGHEVLDRLTADLPAGLVDAELLASCRSGPAGWPSSGRARRSCPPGTGRRRRSDQGAAMNLSAGS